MLMPSLHLSFAAVVLVILAVFQAVLNKCVLDLLSEEPPVNSSAAYLNDLILP